MRVFGGVSNPATQGIGLGLRWLLSWGMQWLWWGKCSYCALFRHTLNDAIEDQRDPITWCPQAIECRHHARGDLASTGLALQIRNRFAGTMMAVPDKGMNIFVRNATIVTIQMWASKASRGLLLLAATQAFALRVGDHVILADEGP